MTPAGHQRIEMTAAHRSAGLPVERNRFRTIPAAALAPLASALFGYLDYLTGPEFSFSLFYLIPVAWVAWQASLLSALATGALAAVVSVAVDLLTATHYTHWTAPYWNGMTRLVIFVLVTFAFWRIRGTTEELRAHNANRLSAQEAERRRVALDLHDSVSQLLGTVQFRLAGLREMLDAKGKEAPHLADLESLLRKAMDTITRISHNLRPDELDELGFVPAVRGLLHEFSERTGVAAHVEAGPVSRYPSEIELSLYRLIQEALNNVEKHARARNVIISIAESESELTVRVRDDGIGIRMDKPGREGGRRRLGLVGMRERASVLGGQFAVRRTLPAGTEVLVRLPKN